MNKQPRMIDADKLMEWLKQKNERLHNELVHQLNFLDWKEVAPDPIPLPNINQTLETIIEELQYALTNGDDANREFYIKNAIRFAQEAIDPIPLPTIKQGDKDTANLIADLLFTYINKDSDCPHAFEIKAFENAVNVLSKHSNHINYHPKLFEYHLQRMKELTVNE